MTETIEAKTIPNPKSQIPNVLWLTENYPTQRGGMAVSCDRIVRSLREAGANVDVAHFSSRYLRWKTEQKINGRQFSCPVREDIAHAINRLWNLVENEKYTHIVAFGGLLPMTASPVFAAWLNIPLITLIRGNDFDTGIFSLKRGDILRQALEKSAVVCAVSRDKVEKISALYPNKRIVWTPNGINLNEWEFSSEDQKTAEKFRSENVGVNQRVLGLFGQLKRKKGGLFFLENLLRSGFAPRFHLLLIGDVDEEMADWLEKHRESVNFTTLSFLDRYELLPYYAACDFVVIPSFYDGMPNVLLEAAALGIPAIASNTGGMRDVLKDEETAILFETGSEDSCRQAIERAAHILEDLADMKEKCVQLARGFSPQGEAQKYLKVFAGQPINGAIMLKNKNLLTSVLIIGLLIFVNFACKNGESKPNIVSTPAPNQSTSPNTTANSYGNRVKIKTPDDKTAVEISFDGSGAKIEFGGKTIRSESKDAEKRKYFDGSTQIAEVKMKDADGFKLRTTDGKLLWKVKIADGKIKISDNEENQNAYELVKKDDGAKIEQNENKLGEVKFYTDRQKIKVKDAADKELFDGNTDKYSVSYGALLLNKIPEAERYIIIAELLARNL